MSESARAEAERWLAAEPDADIRTELEALLAGPEDELAERFNGRLQFGTAGLRAAVGAGPQRMNRLVVRQAAAGLAVYLLATDPRARERGVIIGYDARRKSDVFALDTACVMASYGIRAMLFDQFVPTPVLAWSITEVDAAAGVVVTASHNPPADNGYKVYLGDGAQIVPPHDTGISARIDEIDPVAVDLAPHDHPLIESVGSELIDAYIAAAPGVRLSPEGTGRDGGVHRDARRRRCGARCVRSRRRVCRHPWWSPSSSSPTARSRRCRSPTPKNPARWTCCWRSRPTRARWRRSPTIPMPIASAPRSRSRTGRGGDSAVTSSAGCSPSTSSTTHRATTASSSRRSCRRRCSDAWPTEYGVHHAETFTGFKWIGRTVLDRPNERFVFGYEQALGYLVTHQPLDKDGITAAIMFAEVAALAAADGVTLQDRLDAIAERYGRHVMAELSIRMEPALAAAQVETLRASPPAEIAGRRVVEVATFPEANLLRLVLDGGVRVQIRPSGTEPKVKLYGEAVGEDPAPFVAALAALLT